MDTKKASVKEKDDPETHSRNHDVTMMGFWSVVYVLVVTTATIRVQGITMKTVDKPFICVNLAKTDPFMFAYLFQGIVFVVTLAMIYGNLKGNAVLMAPYLCVKRRSLTMQFAFLLWYMTAIVNTGELDVALDFVSSVFPYAYVEKVILMPIVEDRIEELFKAKKLKTGFTTGDDNNPINAHSTVGGITR